jgi:hypothetical protein
VPVVIFVTPVFVLLVVHWICYGCYVQHRLEMLDMRVDFFIAFRQMRGDLINENA